MGFMKRIFLFLALNILVVFTISILLKVLGVGPYLTAYGMNYTALAAFCLVWGMGGAFISLGLSRIMAKWMMGVQVLDPNTRDSHERQLIQTVYRLSRSAGLSVMPEVGIYRSPEVNAFATGPTRSRALVAVSTGLLDGMTQDEIEGVLGHEVAHVANGDMVTMTLLQGVVNAFAMFLSRVIAYAIVRGDREDSRGRDGGMLGFVIQMVLQMVFLVLGSMLVAWFSRYREYRADAGGAKFAGRNNMVRALQRLQSTMDRVDGEAEPSVAAMKISSGRSGFLSLFATHPPLEDRIARLQGRV